MVLFSMVIKVFSVRRDRDLVYLAVLSFLMLLAAAVLTIDSLFLLNFSLFILVAIATFVSMEMRRSEREALAAGIPAPPGRTCSNAHWQVWPDCLACLRWPGRP